MASLYIHISRLDNRSTPITVSLLLVQPSQQPTPTMPFSPFSWPSLNSGILPSNLNTYPSRFRGSPLWIVPHMAPDGLYKPRADPTRPLLTVLPWPPSASRTISQPFNWHRKYSFHLCTNTAPITQNSLPLPWWTPIHPSNTRLKYPFSQEAFSDSLRQTSIYLLYPWSTLQDLNHPLVSLRCEFLATFQSSSWECDIPARKSLTHLGHHNLLERAWAYSVGTQ